MPYTTVDGRELTTVSVRLDPTELRQLDELAGWLREQNSSPWASSRSAAIRWAIYQALGAVTWPRERA